MIGEKNTASYKLISDDDGNSYEFFCDLSGALVCKTEKKYVADSPEQELLLAWENEGKKHFNSCRKCGRFVIDAMFNPDILSCVKCTPIEDYPDFCPRCGTKTSDPAFFCTMCGATLLYEGENEDEKDESI